MKLTTLPLARQNLLESKMSGDQETSWIRFGMLQTVIERRAAEWELDGDMFDDSQPAVGTMREQLMIAEFQRSLPPQVVRPCADLAKLLVSRLILSSSMGRSSDPLPITPPIKPATASGMSLSRRITRGRRR